MYTGTEENNARVEMYIEMETLVIVRQNNYWGSGVDLADAERNYRKASGKSATSAAVVCEFTGTPDELERISIDDVDGTITYPKSVKKLG